MEEELNEDEENTEEQKKNRGDNLKPWHFKPGQSGNPGGRPKGTISLKEYAKRYLQELSEEDKIKFMEGLSKDIIWKMAEGNPHNTEESKMEVTLPQPLLNALHNNDSDEETSQPEEENQSDSRGNLG